jgi:hypothetical protein
MNADCYIAVICQTPVCLDAWGSTCCSSISCCVPCIIPIETKMIRPCWRRIHLRQKFWTRAAHIEVGYLIIAIAVPLHVLKDNPAAVRTLRPRSSPHERCHVFDGRPDRLAKRLPARGLDSYQRAAQAWDQAQAPRNTVFRGPVNIPQRYGLREEATSIVLSCSSALGKSHRLRRRHALVTLRLWQCHGCVYSRVHNMDRKAT